MVIAWDDFKVFVMALRTAYTSERFLPDSTSAQLWHKMLCDLDYAVLDNAIMQYIATEKFPPTIADIRKLASGVTSEEPLSWGDAWEQVIRAIRKHGYMNELEALNSMDPLTRKCVKRLGWQNICMSENISADRANFRMIYEADYEKELKTAQIPIGLRKEKAHLLEQSICKQLTARAEKHEERNNRSYNVG